MPMVEFAPQGPQQYSGASPAGAGGRVGAPGSAVAHAQELELAVAEDADVQDALCRPAVAGGVLDEKIALRRVGLQEVIGKVHAPDPRLRPDPVPDLVERV